MNNVCPESSSENEKKFEAKSGLEVNCFAMGSARLQDTAQISISDNMLFDKLDSLGNKLGCVARIFEELNDKIDDKLEIIVILIHTS